MWSQLLSETLVVPVARMVVPFPACCAFDLQVLRHCTKRLTGRLRLQYLHL